MPIYRLGENGTTPHLNATPKNPEQPVSTFSRKLGVALTLEEGPATPHYMMAYERRVLL